MRYFKRRWDESRGDQFDAWGQSWWFFETDDQGNVTRQMEAYEQGRTLRYNAGHIEDQYGGLSEEPLNLNEFRTFEITRAEFESAWNTGASFDQDAS